MNMKKLDEAGTPIFTTALSSIPFSYAPLVNRAFHPRPGPLHPWGAVYVPCNWDFFARDHLLRVSNLPFQFSLLPGVISQPSQRSLARSPTSGMSDSRLLSVCCEDVPPEACQIPGCCLYAARMSHQRHVRFQAAVCMLRGWFVTCWSMGPCLYPSSSKNLLQSSSVVARSSVISFNILSSVFDSFLPGTSCGKKPPYIWEIVE